MSTQGHHGRIEEQLANVGEEDSNGNEYAKNLEKFKNILIYSIF
jgi:hypothetical protein